MYVNIVDEYVKLTCICGLLFVIVCSMYGYWLYGQMPSSVWNLEEGAELSQSIKYPRGPNILNSLVCVARS